MALMDDRVRTTIFVGLLGGLALLCSPDPAWPQRTEADPEIVQRPEWSIGDWWEFRNTKDRWRLTVVARDGAQYVLVRTAENVPAVAAAGRRTYLADLDGWITRTVEPDGKAKDTGDKFEWVQFPLKLGTSWSFFVQSTTVKGDKAYYAYQGNAEGWESIQIGTRTVRALKVTHLSRNRDTSGSFSHTGWYAPDAKRLVRLISHYAGGPTVDVTAWNVQGLPGAPAVASHPAPPAATAAPSPPAQTVEAPKPSPPSPSPLVAAAPPADVEAPKIVINYPPPDAKVEREQIVVLGFVTDNVGVDRVRVTVNGVDLAQPTDGGAIGKGVSIRVPVPLQPGDNVIEITAADKVGNVSQVVRTVTRVIPQPPTPPITTVSNRWAVVIGVGQYEQKGIPTLRYAVRDAEAVYRFLTTKGGYPKENVLLLTDTTLEKPTLQNIRRAFGDFLFRKPGRNDMVLIYYAGHGAPEVDAAGTENDGLSKYLIPRDADPDSLYSTAFPMDEIQRIFARIASERVVLLLDTCYSGTAGGRTFARQQTRAANVSDQFLERLTRSRGRVVITASGPYEVALELPDLGHGIFTYYLLEGLGGKADRNGDGIVTVSELYEYVEDQVDRRARAAGGRQRPMMKGEIEGTLPLVQAPR